MSKKQSSMVFFLFLICSFLLSLDAVSCSCATPNFVVWCQDRIRKSTFHHLLWHVWKNFCHFWCVQEVQAYIPSVFLLFIGENFWDQLGTNFLHVQFEGQNFVDGLAIQIQHTTDHSANVDQTSRDPSLWSHFCPFLTCKLFHNEVRLQQSHGHPKMLYAT